MPNRQKPLLGPGVRPKVRTALEELYNWIDAPAGLVRYVSRNKSASGNGKSWDEAYLTINEAITEINAAYTAANQPHKGRNNIIFVGEGWYAELPQTLTASDTFIVGVAPGHHYNTVLYGVPVAGTFSGVAGGPALKITGSNNQIINMGFYTSDPLYPAVRIGANASDPDGPTASAPTGNAIIDCSIVRDVADGELSGIRSYGADYTLIDGCSFSTSCLESGVEVLTNGVVNPVNTIIRNCDFVGTPVGIKIGATAHNTLIQDNIFRDDSSDRADTITTPVTNAGTASSTVCIGNYWAFSDANAVTGNQAMMKGNFQLAAT
jgi:hypothetical protein